MEVLRWHAMALEVWYFAKTARARDMSCRSSRTTESPQQLASNQQMTRLLAVRNERSSTLPKLFKEKCIWTTQTSCSNCQCTSTYIFSPFSSNISQITWHWIVWYEQMTRILKTLGSTALCLDMTRIVDRRWLKYWRGASKINDMIAMWLMGKSWKTQTF